jgi:ribonuclease BN (tRNA processing enzyme)
MDHAGGMQALILARMPLDVYASSDTHSGVVTMAAGCFPEWEPHAEFNRPEVRAGDTREIGGFEVTFFEARHRVPTLAVRVSHGGKTFAFSADSIPCDAIVECARNADLFLCDAICAEADGETAARRARELMHPTARDAATMATRAGESICRAFSSRYARRVRSVVHARRSSRTNALRVILSAAKNPARAYCGILRRLRGSG